MAQLHQALIILSVPLIISGGMTRLSFPHTSTMPSLLSTNLVGAELQESSGPEWDVSAQQSRISQMGINGVIYFDAPPTNSRRRILR